MSPKREYDGRRTTPLSGDPAIPLSEALLVVALLLILALVIAGICRVLPVPYTVVLVIAGMALGAAGRSWPALEPLAHFRLAPELVLFVFLPALIFESGLGLDGRRLARDLAAVLVLAIPAMLLSTVLVSLGLWGLLGIAPLVALLFGALISATDPVAVIALFRELGAPARLTMLLEGESLLNDATAIVAFSIVLGLLSAGVTPDAGALPVAVARFAVVFFGGLAVGLLIGLALGELLRRVRTGASSVLVMSVVIAYLSFIVAEHLLHVSGVMAAGGAALVFGVWGMARVPAADGPVVRATWAQIADVCNALLFLLVGLSVHPGAIIERGGIVLVAVLLVLLARAAAVYGLLPAATTFYRLPRVTLTERHVMWWGGLKGGLAIAMALSIPESVAERTLVLDLTVGVVVFMLLVNAPTIRPLMAALGLARMSAEERAELREGLHGARQAGHRWLARLRAAGGISPMQAGRAGRRLDALLEAKDPAPDDAQRARHLKLEALRAESAALEAMHANGVITQYTYAELRGLLAHDRERDLRESAAVADGRGAGANLFLRAELAVLRELRERSWAAPVFRRYQALRLTQHLRHTVAGILMAQAGLEAIEARGDLPPALREPVANPYHQRLARRRARLAALQREFPDMVRAVGAGLAAHASLAAARLETERAHLSGHLRAKAYGALRPLLDDALAEASRHALPLHAPDARELVALVPALSGLSPAALEALTRHAVPVQFLPGDEVIGEGEHGDALYVVAHGRLEVRRRKADGTQGRIGALGEGDFFGEAALLGESVRSASVIAETACTLVRLTHADVMRVARDEPSLRAALDAAREARRPAG